MIHGATRQLVCRLCVPLKPASRHYSNKTSQDVSPPSTSPLGRPFLNFKYYKENKDAVSENALCRKSHGNVHKVIDLYDEFRAKHKESEDLRQKRNTVAAKVKKEGAEGRLALIEEGKIIKERLAQLEKELAQIEDSMHIEGCKIPNQTHPQVPRGAEDKATLLKLVGSKPNFDFTPKDHIELGTNLGILDMESASKVSGKKFYYLLRDGALLELALVNWAIQKLVSKGFTPVITPDVVHPALVEACGFQPRGEGSQVYWVRDHELCLVGTSEISLASMHINQTYDLSKAPIKLVGFSHCFRAETGGGTYNRGLYRVHQFKSSDSLHQEILQIEEEMYAELGFHFRVLDMPTEDLGASAYRKFDIEAWLPSRNDFGEITSASNCTDHQSRRLNIRCKTTQQPQQPQPQQPQIQQPQQKQQQQQQQQGGPQNTFAHTLNGTACATPRVILALLENFQQKDGSIRIPTPLVPFMYGKTSITPV